MEEEILIDAEQILALAFVDAGYIPSCIITPADILSAQQRFIIPVIGDDLCCSLLAGSYSQLLDDYIAPALAEYVRCSVAIAPVTDNNRICARQLLNRLSNHLEENQDCYSEYQSSNNIFNRCSINGGFVQMR